MYPVGIIIILFRFFVFTLFRPFIHPFFSLVSLTNKDSHADDEGKQRARVAGLADDLSVGGREHGNDQQESAQDLAAEGIANLGPPDKIKHNILFTAAGK